MHVMDGQMDGIAFRKIALHVCSAVIIGTAIYQWHCVWHSPPLPFPSLFSFHSRFLPLLSIPFSLAACPPSWATKLPALRLDDLGEHLGEPAVKCILVHFISKFLHLVRVVVVTAYSAVEACWKSTGRGKFQTIIPFLEGTKLLASHQPKHLREHIPRVPNGLTPVCAVIMTECQYNSLVFVNRRQRLYSYVNDCESENPSDMYRRRHHRCVICVLMATLIFRFALPKCSRITDVCSMCTDLAHSLRCFLSVSYTHLTLPTKRIV